MSDKGTRPSHIAWIVTTVVNLVLGCVGIIPLGFIGIFIVEYPLAALGLTNHEPTDNDGIFPWLVFLAGAGVFLAAWAGINVVLRRSLKIPGRRYWAVSTALLLLPTAVLTLFPVL